MRRQVRARRLHVSSPRQQSTSPAAGWSRRRRISVRRSTALEPVVRRTVNAPSPRNTPAARLWWTRTSRRTFGHSSSAIIHWRSVSTDSRRLCTSTSFSHAKVTKVRVTLTNQSHRLATHRCRYDVVRGLTPMPRNQTQRPSLAVARQQPLHLPDAQTAAIALPHAFRHLPDHARPIRCSTSFPVTSKTPLPRIKGDILTLEKGDITALG